MKVDTRVFTSKVARRAFLLFVTCALLPVSAIAALGYWQVTSELHSQGQRRLQRASKAVAMVLFQRLQDAESSLGMLPAEWKLAGPERQRPFTGVLLVTSDGQSRVISGEMKRPPALTAEQRALLAAGKTVLLTESDATGAQRFVLSRAADRARPERGILHGAVDPAYLWAVQDEAALAAGTRLIVLDASGRVLFSSFDGAITIPAALKRQTTERTTGSFEWNDGREDYLASYWSLFLRYAFGMSKWTVVLNQAKADVFSPIADFKRTFFFGVLLTVWVVLLVSIRQIRKNLKPLDRLQEGTRQLARGQLDTRVNVTSGDEFEELAVSFNQMASQLGRQFDALAMRREISATLSAAKPLDETLQACGDLLARHLDLSRVGIWIAAGDGAALGLRASTGAAGEPPRSFPLEPERLEALARARRPYATNTLTQDARLCDAVRADREGLVAFVAHPLMVDERFMGLAAAYGTHPLDGLDLSGFGAAAGDIARWVDGKRVAEALQDSEVQLRQLQKMEAVGRLAGGIAHDFNNLLTVIMGRSNLLLHRLAADHPHRKSLENIEETTQRAALLTRQLLAFSRKQVLTPTVLDVEGVVAGMLEMFQRLIGENIELAFTPGPELGRVRIDRGQAEQVLVNLVVNARDAMPEGGRITIEIAEVALDEGDAGRVAGLPAGPYIVLTVSDTGAGMDEHTKARIFEPFFTTKEPGKGTGLGLATVYGIVRQSEGGVTVESQLGVGTSFKIYLPRVDGVVEEETAAVAPVGRGTETVLLVEDETHVRSLVETVLAEHGYHVLTAGRPREAVRLAERHAGPIHLLLSDMVMPEMSGSALARQILPLRPEMVVLFMSGYADYPAEQATGGGLLQKPFTPDALARAVRGALDTPAPLVQPAAR